MSNNRFRDNVRALGYCCIHAYIRVNIRPKDTIVELADKAGVSEATIKVWRRKFRDRECVCERLTGCWKALWMTPHASRKLEAEWAEEAERLGLERCWDCAGRGWKEGALPFEGKPRCPSCNGEGWVKKKGEEKPVTPPPNEP